MNGIRAGIILIALGLRPVSGSAQRPEGAEGLSKAAVAESLKVLATLRNEALKKPDNAALQFRIGRIAYALVLRSMTRDSVPGLNRMEMLQTGTTALSRATNLDGNNIDYLMMYSSYMTTAYGGRQRGELSAQLLDRAARIAAQSRDTTARLTILMKIADASWLLYERALIDTVPMEGFPAGIPTNTVADPEHGKPREEAPRDWASPRENFGTTAGVSTAGGLRAAVDASVKAQMERDVQPSIRMTNSGVPSALTGPVSILQAAGRNGSGDLKRLLAAGSMGAIERLSRKGGDRPTELQESHYLIARMLYDSAFAIAPNDERAWRGVAKTRVALTQWADLERIALVRLSRAEKDQWAWMAIGLARQRLRQTDNARAAFDSGLARMPAKERSHLDRVDRLMRPSDLPAYAKLDSAGKEAYATASWFLADPLWSVNAEEPRLEFLARLAHAELRWGRASPHVYGADTYDGMKFVRYGPPVKKLNNLSLYPGGIILSEFGPWAHTRAFGGAVRMDSIAVVPRIYEWQPARWDNMTTIDIDSMPAQAARFRAGSDSVDFFFATLAPMAKLDSARTRNTKPFAKFWMYGWNTPDVITDSITPTGTGAMQWSRRVPAGMYNYRVEAVMPGTLAAARAAANIIAGADSTTGFSMQGFGMSDFILATVADMPGTARRWNDVTFTPLMGAVTKGGNASILWENYDVARRGNDAQYHVTITLAREEISGGRVSIEVVDGLVTASSTPIKRTVKDNQITLDFDRTVPFSPIIVDNLTLSFGDTPPGSYILKMIVTDQVSGQTTSRSTTVVIRK